jgi:sensor histidine kinase YesM
MRPEGALHVGVTVESDGCDVLISVSDDGVGMTREQAQRLVEEAGPSEAGTGIALRNVDARLHAVFGPGSGVEVSSETGVGTVVTLHLCGALSTPSAAEV